MPRHQFRDIITLYTKIQGVYNKRVINSVLTKYSQALVEGKTVLTVYIPLNIARDLIYVDPDGYDASDNKLFTVKLGQMAVIGNSNSIFPPAKSLPVQKVEKRTLGSRRLQHIKLTIYEIVEEDSNE